MQTNGDREPRIPSPGSFEQVTLSGVTLKFTRVNMPIREEFSLWAMKQAYERLERLKPNISEVEYVRKLQRLDDLVDAGAFDWGFPQDADSCGSMIWKCREHGEGPAILARMMLREHHPNMTAQELADIYVKEEKAARAEKRPNRFQETALKALDPNVVSPPQQAGITTEDISILGKGSA